MTTRLATCSSWPKIDSTRLTWSLWATTHTWSPTAIESDECGTNILPSRAMPTTTACRSGNSSVSCDSGVSTTGQFSAHTMPTTTTSPLAKRTVSNAPGSASRRSTISPTSTSGEMITSIGRWLDANRSLQCGCR